MDREKFEMAEKYSEYHQQIDKLKQENAEQDKEMVNYYYDKYRIQ